MSDWFPFLCAMVVSLIAFWSGLDFENSNLLHYLPCIGFWSGVYIDDIVGRRLKAHARTLSKLEATLSKLGECRQENRNLHLLLAKANCKIAAQAWKKEKEGPEKDKAFQKIVVAADDLFRKCFILFRSPRHSL